MYAINLTPERVTVYLPPGWGIDTAELRSTLDPPEDGTPWCHFLSNESPIDEKLWALTVQAYVRAGCTIMNGRPADLAETELAVVAYGPRTETYAMTTVRGTP